MVTNKAGIELIKEFEGCELEAYNDSYGNITIGYGHCDSSYAGKTITQEEAERLFNADVKRFEVAVSAYMPKYNFNENEFSALVSFAFNCGEGQLAEMLHYGEVKREDITYRMSLYVHADGEVSPGLERRRKAEIELFNTKCGKTIDYYFNLVANTLLNKYGVDHERKKKLGADYEIVQNGINTLYDYLNKNI